MPGYRDALLKGAGNVVRNPIDRLKLLGERLAPGGMPGAYPWEPDPSPAIPPHLLHALSLRLRNAQGGSYGPSPGTINQSYLLAQPNWRSHQAYSQRGMDNRLLQELAAQGGAPGGQQRPTAESPTAQQPREQVDWLTEEDIQGFLRGFDGGPLDETPAEAERLELERALEDLRYP